MQAVTVGFEPTAPLRVQLLSREPLSATQSRYQKTAFTLSVEIEGFEPTHPGGNRFTVCHDSPTSSYLLMYFHLTTSIAQVQLGKKSAPGRTRTADTSLRRAVLYPPELQKQVMRIPMQSCHMFQHIRKPGGMETSAPFPDCLSSCGARVHRFTRRCQLGHRTYVASFTHTTE